MNISDHMFGDIMNRLERSMDLRSVRHQLILSNIANADTPGYKAFDLVLKEASANLEFLSENPPGEKPHPRHIPIPGTGMEPEYKVSQIEGTDNMRGDGNTVSIDLEMTKMAENTLMYEAMARIVRNRFQTLNEAISGGGTEA